MMIDCSSKLQISDLDATGADFEQKLTLEESGKIVGGDGEHLLNKPRFKITLGKCCWPPEGGD